MTTVVRATVVDRRPLSHDVCALTFRSSSPLTGLAPGAHVDLHLGEDLVRSYSLVDWDSAGASLTVAVKAEPEGRGGSRAAHLLRVGDDLALTPPRNNFPLCSGDRPSVLIAGGIGVTPLYAMARELKKQGRSFELHYYVRSRDLAAFDGHLGALELGEGYRLHCDDVDGRPDFAGMIAERPAETDYYVCGPEPMLDAIVGAAAQLGRGTVHFERFAAVAPVEGSVDRPFEVVLDRTGEVLQVPADRSILQVLRDAGQDVEYSCGEGTCGTCILDVLEGEIEHRDAILTDDEKAAGDCLCVCVSRAAGPRLVLDA